MNGPGNNARKVARLGEVRLEKEDSRRGFREQIEKLGGSIDVVEKAFAKNGVEFCIFCDVPSIVTNELKVRQARPLLHESASVDIHLPHVQPEHVESQAGKLHRISTFKTSKIRDAKPLFRAGESDIEDSFGGKKPRVLIHRGANAWARAEAVVKTNIVLNKSGHRSS